MRVEPPHALADLFARPDLQRLPAGRVLFDEGEQPDGVFILHSGDVNLSSLIEGHNTRLRTARAGEILGLMAVVSGRTHLSSAVTASPCEVTFIAAAEFRKLIDESPAAWFSVLRQLSRDVNASYDVIRERGRC